jgi:hypothetical protein
MENLQVYRVRFGTDTPVISNLDQPRATTREATALPPVPVAPSSSER